MEIVEKDKWECFSDPSYFDKWAVRNTRDKSFNSAIHVNTMEEAKFLVGQLNKVDSITEFMPEIKSILSFLSWEDMVTDRQSKRIHSLLTQLERLENE